MIFKFVKHDHPFTLVDKRVAKDKRLSLKAKGLMLIFMGLPEDWTIRRDWLIDQSCDGREAVQSGMQELKECGYAELVNEQDDKGRTLGKRWVVVEHPDLLEPTLLALGRVSPPTENPLDGKAAPTKNNSLIENELDKEAPELDLGIEIEYTDEKKAKEPKVSAADKVAREAWLDAQCERIYSAYPKKCNPKAAKKEIRKCLKEIEADWLFEKVRDYAICRAGEDPQFTRNPDNWFRDGNYSDDPSLWRTATRFPQKANLPTQGSPVHKGLSAAERREARRAA